MRDLQSTKAMWLKAWLFLLIGLVAGGLLLIEHWSWRTALLLGLCVWGFCRFYYFAFYVIERWVDGKYRFSGLWDFLRYALRTKSGGDGIRGADERLTLGGYLASCLALGGNC